MTLRLEENWLWDFWYVWRGEECHLFYVQAPRSLGSEELRHHHATIGHAVSQDLRQWTVARDALQPGADGDWDDLATWTGSVIGHDDRWYMLYTGVKRSEDGLVQRIGLAISTDLYHWDKDPGNPILEADPRWYELLDLGSWYEQAWRDPWLFKDQANNSFHAFITARARSGDNDARGVIGHARSSNLRDWEVLAPIHAPAEFGHLEVPQLVPFGNRFFLLFSCGPKHTSRKRIARLKAPPSIGTFCLVADQALGPFDFTGDGLLVGDADGSYYGGKFIEDRSKRLKFMAFSLFGHDGRFVGELTDPLPVVFDQIDRPHVAMPSEGQSRTRPAP